jgi:hypothetical protein
VRSVRGSVNERICGRRKYRVWRIENREEKGGLKKETEIGVEWKGSRKVREGGGSSKGVADIYNALRK